MKLFPSRILQLFLLFLCFSQISASTPSQQQIFVGITFSDYDNLTDYFLKSLENLDYDKKKIFLQLNLLNSSQHVKNTVLAWKEKNQNRYQTISLVDDSDKLPFNGYHQLLAQIQDDHLTKSKQLNCSYCLISASDAFLAPMALKYLIEKDKPVIAPMLRPAPLSGDLYRNFFGDVTESGYYQAHPDYDLISTRQKIGTFQVPCISKTYLIRNDYFDKVSFSKNYSGYEFITFGNNARKERVDQYLCNEKEFGFLMHWDNSTPQARKKFIFKNDGLEINPTILHQITSPYYVDNEGLKQHIQNFNYDNYLIFRIENETLFYLDDIFDYIKSYFLKNGYVWEEAFHQHFSKYITPGSIAIDIGAHIGTQTLAMSKYVGNNGTVYAFEPQNKLFTELAVNTYLNDIKNVKLQHKALGNDQKFIQIQIPDEGWNNNRSSELVNIINEGHGTVVDAPANAEGAKTELVHLDSYQLNNVSFIKIDVEGFEMDVIKGGIETIVLNKPVMIIEIFDGPETKKRLTFLENLGYSYTHLGSRDYLFIPKEKL